LQLFRVLPKPMRRQLHILFLLLVLVGGCTNTFRKSNGNAEGYSGIRPVPGNYYVVDSRAGCADSSTTGHRAVIQVGDDLSVSYRPSCGGSAVALSLSDLEVSPLGAGGFESKAPLLSHQNALFDKIDTVPSATNSADLLTTRSWCRGISGTDRYQLILRAQGTVERPTNVKAIVIKALKNRTLQMIGEVATTAALQAGRTRYTAPAFDLNIVANASTLTGTFIGTVGGTALSLTSLACGDTFQTPPPATDTMPRVLLSAGSAFSCGSISGGQAACWGKGDFGQLGDGTQTNASGPTPIALAGPVSALTAGGQHACAVRNGQMWCWGSNDYYQTRSGNSTDPEPAPVRVTLPLDLVTSVATGGQHSCLVYAKAVKCFGRNNAFQLGTNPGNPNEVVDVPGIAGDVVQVTAGLQHSCALTVDGDAYCWGDNSKGQIGQSSTGQPLPAMKVPGIKFVFLAPGGNATCGINTQGRVVCWGDNGSAQVSGNAATSSYQMFPTVLASMPGPVTALSVGSNFACAVQSGRLNCWGANDMGQAGLGNTTAIVAVSTVPGITDAYHVAAGESHALGAAITSLWAWGNNLFGQIGNGTTGGNLLSPVAISLP